MQKASWVWRKAIYILQFDLRQHIFLFSDSKGSVSHHSVCSISTEVINEINNFNQFLLNTTVWRVAINSPFGFSNFRCCHHSQFCLGMWPA